VNGEETGAISDAVVILVTGPDVEMLKVLALSLVRGGYAACVNLVPGVTSVYRWKGAVQTDPEALAVIKTTRERVDEAMRRVLELHPYEAPEFLVLPVEGGAQAYLEWISRSVAGGSENGEA
jgi:periplasmic divalent cation tolerance protein